MNFEEIEGKAEKLVSLAEKAFDSSKAEAEAYSALTEELNNMAPRERRQLAIAMEHINVNHIFHDAPDMLPTGAIPWIIVDHDVIKDGTSDVSSVRVWKPRPWYDIFGLTSPEYKDIYNIRPERW